MIMNLGVVALVLWGAQAGLVAPNAVEQAAGEAAPAGGTLSMRYTGVAPGPDGKSPFSMPRSEPGRLVWTGFRLAGDKSEVFLQTTRPPQMELGVPTVKTKGAARTLSVFLRNCRIHLQNNRRTLDTRFFPTPVARVTARQRRKDVELLISLKEDAHAEPRTEVGPDGTHFLVLQFPLGKPDAPPVAAGDADGAGSEADHAGAAHAASARPVLASPR